MAKKENELQLFRVVRQGYDPRQVLSCIKEMTAVFKQSEDWHTHFQEALRDEFLILKLESDEDKKCLVELRAQMRALKMENQQLRRRLMWEGKDDAGGSGEEDAASGWPRGAPRGTSS